MVEKIPFFVVSIVFSFLAVPAAGANADCPGQPSTGIVWATPSSVIVSTRPKQFGPGTWSRFIPTRLMGNLANPGGLPVFDGGLRRGLGFEDPALFARWLALVFGHPRPGDRAGLGGCPTSADLMPTFLPLDYSSCSAGAPAILSAGGGVARRFGGARRSGVGGLRPSDRQTDLILAKCRDPFRPQPGGQPGQFHCSMQFCRFLSRRPPTGTSLHRRGKSRSS